MPSPRRPMRAMSSRSITLGSEQEFAISFAAEDRGSNGAEHAPAERRNGARQILADGGMDPGVADDALLGMGAAGFELRLDERDQPRGRLRQSQRRRPHE